MRILIAHPLMVKAKQTQNKVIGYFFIKTIMNQIIFYFTTLYYKIKIYYLTIKHCYIAK